MAVFSLKNVYVRDLRNHDYKLTITQAIPWHFKGKRA